MAASPPLTSTTSTKSLPIEPQKPKLLLGEGIDEVNIFSALLRHLGIDDIQVEQYGGKDMFRDVLAALVLQRTFRDVISLGVTRDADNNAAAAFASICDALRNQRLVTPSRSGAIEVGSPRIGVMILPDGHSDGALEDLCFASLHTDPILPCIDQYFACVGSVSSPSTRPNSKARIHAWLAAQTPPDLRLGHAIGRGWLDWNNAAFDELKNFIRAL